ncbi:MAG TPA: nickel insertion protein [Nitrososphaerales archaeon]|nr:nickel insertion protein [Nitrososphaerales archaeon]
MPRSSAAIRFEKETVAIVETNVDDISGEILGRTIERLLEEGAYDATVTPFLGKKGRMGQTVRVVCNKVASEKFAQILVEETGTLGVKTAEWTRMMVPRKILSIPVRVGRFQGKVNVKAAKIANGIRFKPEFEEVREIAIREKIPLRRVMEIISEQAAQAKSGF